MGQCVSATEHKFSLMREGSSHRFYRSKNGNLSATFHVLDSDLRWDLLNINSATEEQLMTLPGINRVTAENILEYRQRIGGFRKVEDLALVSGVGATKLEQFRTEICVGRRKANNGSYNSSLTQSLESLQVIDGSSRTSPSKLVNVNTANVFQLMAVCRMTQEMAAHIVHYRERKGPFKALADLSKVKGLPPDRLAIVKMYLTTDSSVNNSHSSVQSSRTSQNCVYGHRPIGHRRTNSAPSGLSKSRSCDPSTKDFYELVSSLVTRPAVEETFNFNYLDRQVLRMASWNLQDFVVQKARNPGVQEVICRTILENGFSIVAVQEIASREALSLIASELNEPKLYAVQSWKGDRGKWHSLVPSHNSGDSCRKKTHVNGFLYDTSRGIQLQDSSVLFIPPEKLVGLSVTCQPFFVSFKVKSLDFVIVTFSLVSETSVSKLLPSILEQLKEKLPGKKNIFLVGDFILPPGHTVFEVLSSQGYSNLLPVETSLSDSGNWQEDSHMWSSLNVRKIFSGRSGVVSDGLCHLAIPDGWKWGGSVSGHCPVWAEVFTEEEPCSSVTPLLNGVGKVPGHTDYLGDKIRAFEDHPKSRSRGFWERSWPWRHRKHHHHADADGAVPKENGSL